jgi:hypothetical protein
VHQTLVRSSLILYDEPFLPSYFNILLAPPNIFHRHLIFTMSFQKPEELRTLTRSLLKDITISPQFQEPTSPIFHNLPWLPERPMPHMEGLFKLPGELVFELPSSMPEKQQQVIYAEVWLNDSPPPYSPRTSASPAPSIRPSKSNDSISTFHSAKSHISQRSANEDFARKTPSLRRKQTPQELTLRQMRKMESEAELRRAYEERTDAYLEEFFQALGSPIARPLSVILE